MGMDYIWQILFESVRSVATARGPLAHRPATVGFSFTKIRLTDTPPEVAADLAWLQAEQERLAGIVTAGGAVNEDEAQTWVYKLIDLYTAVCLLRGESEARA